MQVYLVGGAVRDAQLGLPVHERDWVVVGATEAQMLELGYRPVGRDFPVFLHPDTHEEYALARTERKSAPGHTGFVFHAAPDVSLEMDLRRRDLTINAMAQHSDGTLIDPCGGAADLQARLLRHVSSAFSEDPLRVLRVARFAARFAPLGFTIAAETLALMRDMSAAGELATLSGERIWRELRLALLTDAPQVFFEVLRQVQALPAVLPLLDTAWETALGRAALSSLALPVREHAETERFAALLGGAALAEATTRAGNSDAVALATAAAELGRDAATALRAPRAVADPAVHLAASLPVLRAPDVAVEQLMTTLERLDPARRPERLPALAAAVCRLLAAAGVEADEQARLDGLLRGLPELFEVDVSALRAAGFEGPELGAEIRALRQRRLQRLLADAPS